MTSSIETLYRSGLTMRQVAAQTGVSLAEVHRMLKPLGISRPKGHRPIQADDPRVAKAVAMRNAGASYGDIADAMGLASRSWAYRLVHKGDKA